LHSGNRSDIYWPLNDLRGIRTQIKDGKLYEMVRLHWQNTWVPLTSIHPEDRKTFHWDEGVEKDSLIPHNLGLREFEWFDVVWRFDIQDHFRIKRSSTLKKLIISPVTSIIAHHIDTWEASRNLGPSKKLFHQLYKLRIQHALDKIE